MKAPSSIESLKKSAFLIAAVVSLLFLILGTISELAFTPRFNLGFHLLDPSISHPIANPETVPVYWLVINVILTVLAYLIIHFYLTQKRDRLIWEKLICVCLFIGGTGLTVFFTDSIKNFASELRPDFLARCDLDLNTLVVFETKNYSAFGPWIKEYQCRGEEKDVLQGRLAFPSGHSSVSFYAFISLLFQVYYVVHPWAKKKWKRFDHVVDLILAFVYGSLILIPSVIAVSRVYDFRHFWHDVVAGAILGVLVAGGMQFLLLKSESESEFSANEEMHEHSSLVGVSVSRVEQ